MAVHRRSNIPNKDSSNASGRKTSIHKKSFIRKQLKTLQRSLGVNQFTLQAAAVLLIAILTAVLWNTFDTVDPDVRTFLRDICRETYCNEILRPTRRTQKAIQDVPKGQRLVEIPRHFLLWDLDALRDKFVQKELFAARIFGQKPLEADVFLSAYIALLKDDKTRLSPILQQYLAILPSFHDFSKFHPALYPQNWTETLLGKHTYSYQLIRHRQQMLILEYEALTNVSSAFAHRCSWTDYVAARLAVLTRSFGTGKLHENERENQGDFESLQEEMDFFKREAGVDLSSGSFAMVPILDLYNHHAHPNVGYSYDPVKRAFVIRSLGLKAGDELWDSYGKHSDPHLYSKFGFINGDGSEATQASLAVWHDLLVLPNETKQEEILRYLSFDDGYKDCVKPDEGPAWELKRLKYQHFVAMAHDPRFWTVVVDPRRTGARPAASSALNAEWPRRGATLQIDLKNNNPDIKGPLGMCRLLVATHDDLEGRPIQLLQDNIEFAGKYILPQPSSPHDALEYRTLKCLERLASQSLVRFGDTTAMARAHSRVATESDHLSDKTRAEWTAAHLVLGELQTLDLLRGMTSATIRHEWPKQEDQVGEGFTLRSKPCHPSLVQPLWKE